MNAGTEDLIEGLPDAGASVSGQAVPSIYRKQHGLSPDSASIKKSSSGERRRYSISRLTGARQQWGKLPFKKTG